MLAGSLVHGGVPHHRRGHYCTFLAGATIGEQHAAVGLLLDRESLGAQRQGVLVVGYGRAFLDGDVLLEARAGGLDDHVSARHGLRVLGTVAIQPGLRQTALPLESDLLVSLAKGHQVTRLRGAGRGQRTCNLAASAGECETARVGFGRNGTVGALGQVGVDTLPASVPLETDRPCGQLGRQGAIPVHPGGAGLGALGQYLHLLPRSPGCRESGRYVGGGQVLRLRHALPALVIRMYL
ncbi:hypothetical protein BEH93_35320 [Streptomyces sp. 2R]|nr:hypothetical protein BEH93_35320 [Streptomyces sp. 2R]